MGSESACNGNAAPESDEPPYLQAIPFWMRTKVTPENSALSAAEWQTAVAGEGSPEGAAEKDDTCVILLRAIAGTEVARRLGGIEPQTDKPAPEAPASPKPAPAASLGDANLGAEAAEDAEQAALASAKPSVENGIAAHDETFAFLLGAIQSAAVAKSPDVPTPARSQSAQEAALPEAAETAATGGGAESPGCVAPAGAAAQPALPPRRAAVKPLPHGAGSTRGSRLMRLGAGMLHVAFHKPRAFLERAEDRLEAWFLKWFDPPDPRRRAPRMAGPPLAAYHWMMEAPQGLKIANISSGGMYLLTHERWTEGVIVSLALQRTDMEKETPESWIAVDFEVTRWCDEGIAGAFIPSTPGAVDAVAGRANNCAGQKTLEQFVMRLETPPQPQAMPVSGGGEPRVAGSRPAFRSN